MKFTTTIQKAIPTTLALGLVLSMPIAAQNLDEPQSPVVDAEQTAPMTDEGSLEYQEPQNTTIEEPVLQAEEVTIETPTDPTLDPELRAEVDGEIVEPTDEYQNEPLTDRNDQMAELDGDDEELPRTASPLPLLLLIGSAGAGSAFGLRRRRKALDS